MICCFVAWIEGAAIMVAVATVATVGSFVDWKKEVQFVISRAKSDLQNVVSFLKACAHAPERMIWCV